MRQYRRLKLFKKDTKLLLKIVVKQTSIWYDKDSFEVLTDDDDDGELRSVIWDQVVEWFPYESWSHHNWIFHCAIFSSVKREKNSIETSSSRNETEKRSISNRKATHFIIALLTIISSDRIFFFFFFSVEFLFFSKIKTQTNVAILSHSEQS